MGGLSLGAHEDEGEYLRVRPDWLAQHVEAVIEPDLPIVDPHHHVWDAPGWRYMFPDLVEDLKSGHNITATIFLQCYSMYRKLGPKEWKSLGETEFANGVAAMAASGAYGKTRVCEGIVGNVNLALGKRAGDVLAKHVEVTSGRFKGIREITTYDPEEAVQPRERAPRRGQLQNTEFLEGFACLAPLGLTFDAWAFHTQLDEIVELARKFPGTGIIMNHTGGPIGVGRFAGKRDEVFADWRAGIGRLASCPNVTMKLGGLGMRISGFGFHKRALPPSSEELAAAWKPYIETCVEVFGPSRCMFESNFPVDKGSYSYGVFWNACKRLAAGCSASEKAELFSGTATRVYRLPSETEAVAPAVKTA